METMKKIDTYHGVRTWHRAGVRQEFYARRQGNGPRPLGKRVRRLRGALSGSNASRRSVRRPEQKFQHGDMPTTQTDAEGGVRA
jgi:hypothetical protein